MRFFLIAFQITNIKKSLAAQTGSIQEADMAGGSSGAGGSEAGREAMPVLSEKKKLQKVKCIKVSGKFWKT